jgi:predicted esterase
MPKASRSSTAQVGALLDREQARGIPPERTFLAGFSQGGAITLAPAAAHAAAGGLIALVDLPADGARRRARNRCAAGIVATVFLAHGDADPVIPCRRACERDDAVEPGLRRHLAHLRHAARGVPGGNPRPRRLARPRVRGRPAG